MYSFVATLRLQGAVKDNDFIYHEVVPELDTLPEIKGECTFKELLELLFIHLLFHWALQMSSVYHILMIHTSTRALININS